eukprot:maker-scaffold362_size196086-snap-gene-0.23 protein:Tk09340 transcript:maker-scaffold362_size196086-snap-gene-0.23-mRNA-1 annotation:"ovochymase-2"
MRSQFLLEVTVWFSLLALVRAHPKPLILPSTIALQNRLLAGQARNQSPGRCVNSHGDFGVCTDHVSCEESNGLHIAFCPLAGVPGAGSCCYHLPCSENFTHEHILNALKQYGLRNAPSHKMMTDGTNPFAAVPFSQFCGHLPSSMRNGHIVSRLTTDQVYPWLLSLWIRLRISTDVEALPICGAALITNRHAITAAHCIAKMHFEYFIQAGTNWNWRLLYSSTVFPICLPPPVVRITDYAGQIVTVAGWGCLQEDCEDDERPIRLRDRTMPIIDNDLAMCWFLNDSQSLGSPEYIPKESFIVAGDESGSSATCSGDSGSPVIRERGFGQWEVIGLVSWSKGCGRRFRPSVLTRVESYTTWVLENIARF